MATPPFENGPNGRRPQGADDIYPYPEAIERDPEAAALALIQAIDRPLSSGCPIHPEPLRSDEGAPVERALSAGINCPLCN